MVYEEKSHVGMFQCYFCGEDAGIVLDRRLRNTLPRRVGVMDMTPCNKCKEYMQMGIILISIANDTTPEEMGKGGGVPNPRRTGMRSVVKEDFVKRVFPIDFADFALSHRFCFLTDESWRLIGLPTEAVNNLDKQ